MGLAMKVALRATGPDRLGLPLHCSLDRQVARSGDPTMAFQCWPYRRDYVQGWIGASAAWELAREGEAAAVDFALGQLRSIFGGRVDRLFSRRRDAGDALGCGSAGAWRVLLCAAGRCGCAQSALAQPLADGHLLFAGEACHDGLAGTLAGRLDQRTGCGPRGGVIR